MPHLFVSYARRDLPIVHALVDELRELGYEPFYDQELAGGQRWWDVLLDRISDADAFLPVISEHFNDSEACRREAEWADRLGLPIVPIDIGRVSPDVCEPHIAEANWVRYSLDDRASLARLARALHTIGPRQAPSPLPERPPIPLKYLAATRHEIRGSATITPERQAAIITALRSKLGTDEDTATRTLLTDLRRRPDITYDAGVQIDQLLKSGRRPPRKPAATPGEGAGGRWGRRGKTIAAVALAVALVGAAVGLWLTRSSGGHPTADGTHSATTPAGGHSMSMSMSMSMSPSPSSSMRMGGSALLTALQRANQATGTNLLPPSSCHAMDAMRVTCMQPSAGVNTVTFQTFPSLTALYNAYLAEVRKVSGAPIKPNVGDCRLHSSSGEVSWNHDFEHFRSFTIHDLETKSLNPATQAAGRVFCQLTDALTVVWTQNDGRVLAIIDGTGFPHETTMQWWITMHHDIAMAGGDHMQS